VAAPKSFVTPAELGILKVLWRSESLTAREIARQLYPKATTSSIGTVQKLIARLEAKHLLFRDRTEAIHRFSAKVSREELAGMQLEALALELADGSLSPFVLHLVRAKRLTQKEKNEIRRMLDEK
jgi:predicted transcriptional regulator